MGPIPAGISIGGAMRRAASPRVLAWCCLLTATGILVRAETRRPTTPDGVIPHPDLVYRVVGDRRVRLDLYVPKGDPPRGGRPAVLAIHGGGWRGGSKEEFGRMSARLAQHGYVVASVDYRLSRPGAPSWPENLEDLRESVRWLRRHADEFGVDRGRVAALGASAGGHLAALLATSPVAGTPDDGTSARVEAVVSFYGPSDLRTIYEEGLPSARSVVLMLGGSPAVEPGPYAAASPATQVTPAAPPMLLIHGRDDLLVPLDQSTRLSGALEEAGVSHRLIVVEGARHGFGFQVGRRDLLPEILAFLDAEMPRRRAGR